MDERIEKAARALSKLAGNNWDDLPEEAMMGFVSPSSPGHVVPGMVAGPSKEAYRAEAARFMACFDAIQPASAR